MATFRDLLIWQKSMLVVTDIYAVTTNFLLRDLHSHRTIEAKCNFNSSNIAEEYGRQGTKDYLKFLNIAIASLFEMQTQIEIAYNLKYIEYNLTRYTKTAGK
jgi:four helix bundle protein